MSESAKCKWQVETFARRENITLDNDFLYLIKKGAVKISTYDRSGKIIVLGYWGKGDVIGQSLTKINPYEVECLTAIELECVPYPEWDRVAKEIRNCYQDTERVVYILGQNSIEEKLLELLIYLDNKFGSTKLDKKAILLHLSHRELAEFLGSTRVSITRAMNRLQSKKLIECPKRGSIVLCMSEIQRLEHKF